MRSLSGILERLGTGVVILPERAPDPSEASNPFYAEVLDGHVGYMRLGVLTAANLKAMDANLQSFREKKIDAVVIDLLAQADDE